MSKHIRYLVHDLKVVFHLLQAIFWRWGADPAKCRPLLVKTANKQMRDSLLEEAKKLKDKEDGVPLAQKVGYDSVYVKKDIHPSVRREWKRLRDLVDTEKVKPANQGCDIKLDPKTRTVTRNGVVIDRWHLLNF